MNRTKISLPQKQKRETLLEIAARIGRLGETGPRDLAMNMDAYLYGGKK